MTNSSMTAIPQYAREETQQLAIRLEELRTFLESAAETSLPAVQRKLLRRYCMYMQLQRAALDELNDSLETQTPVPESPDKRPANCQRRMMETREGCPRTCPICSLGPCPYPQPTGQEAGL